MAGIVALTCHLVNPLHQPPVLHLNMQYICHRRSLTPNLASSDLRRLIVASIVNGFAIDMVNTMVVLICTPAALALMITMTVEGQWPRFVVSTATD